MKSTRMLGLTAFAALTAMALAYSPTAMAGSTQLCTGDPSGTGCGSAVTHVHEGTLAGAKATILSGPINVECDVLFLGETGGLGAPLIIEGTFSYSNCNSNCTVTNVNFPRVVNVLRTGTELAEDIYEYLVNVVCNGIINCSYDGLSLKGTRKGPLALGETNGEVSIQNQTLHKDGGFLCPSTAKLDIVLTPLSATYIGT